MIKYRPHRETMSASIKEEQVFSSQEDMIAFLHDWLCRIAAYIGSTLPSTEDITITGQGWDNFQTGYRNERKIIIHNHCIGYCGE